MKNFLKKRLFSFQSKAEKKRLAKLLTYGKIFRRCLAAAKLGEGEARFSHRVGYERFSREDLEDFSRLTGLNYRLVRGKDGK